MTTKAEIRRARLRTYIADECNGNAADLARKVGKSESQINDMIHARKSFGEKVARDIESALSLPKDWLDGEPDEATMIAHEILSLSKEARDHIMWIIEQDKANRKIRQ